MDNKTECEIVKDLAIPFSENLINEGSKKFVEEHLKKCNNCKTYYENFKAKIFQKQITENNKGKLLFNNFKKINRHINILKILLIIILIIITFSFSLCAIRYNKNTNIINKSFNKMQSLKELNNYKLTVKVIYKNFNTNKEQEYEDYYFYKDGKYKEENMNGISFYDDNSYDSIYVDSYLKKIYYSKKDFLVTHKGEIINSFADRINRKHELMSTNKLISKIYIMGDSIREERFNGIDCYVIRYGNCDENHYTDIWIDKEQLIVIREVNDYPDYYNEYQYTFIENVVTDEDLSTNILETDKYKDYTKTNTSIKWNELSDFEKLYYETITK